MRKLTIILGVAASVALSTGSVLAIDASFFGQDLGNGDGNANITAWPNAAAAQAQFLANLVGVGTETFESFADNAPAPFTLTFPGAGTATLNGTGSDTLIQTTEQASFGRFPISGTKYVETSSGFNIRFGSPVAAFGFYGVDVGDFNGDLTLTFVDGTTRTFDLTQVMGTPGGSVMYFGYINSGNPFTGVTFSNSQGGTDYFGFDDMTIGSVEQVVSAPDSGNTLGLTGLALLSLMAVAYKQR